MANRTSVNSAEDAWKSLSDWRCQCWYVVYCSQCFFCSMPRKSRIQLDGFFSDYDVPEFFISYRTMRIMIFDLGTILLRISKYDPIFKPPWVNQSLKMFANGGVEIVAPMTNLKILLSRSSNNHQVTFLNQPSSFIDHYAPQLQSIFNVLRKQG